MRILQSKLRVDLPRIVANVDVDTFRQLQPIHIAIYQLISQLSDSLGYSILTSAETAELGFGITSRAGELLTGTVQLTESVSTGDLLNLYNSSGLRGRKASRAAGTKKPARAVALAAGVNGDVIRICLGYYLLSGSFTAGAELYLGAAGALATSKTLVVGEVHQSVGVALSSTVALIYFQAPFVVYARNPQSTATGSLVQDENGTTLYGSGNISGVLKYYEPVLVPLN